MARVEDICINVVFSILFVKTVFRNAGWLMFNPSRTTVSPHPLRSRSADFCEHQHSYNQPVMTLFTFLG